MAALADSWSSTIDLSSHDCLYRNTQKTIEFTKRKINKRKNIYRKLEAVSFLWLAVANNSRMPRYLSASCFRLFWFNFLIHGVAGYEQNFTV
jgi:hypothetical protein